MTATNQLRYRSLLGQSWRRTHIALLTHRLLQPLNFAPCACFVGRSGGGHTSITNTPYTAAPRLRLSGLPCWRSWRRNYIGKGTMHILCIVPFSCSSIIQTPPFPVASRSDHRTPYSRDPPHLLFYSSPSAALTMVFPPPLLS